MWPAGSAPLWNGSDPLSQGVGPSQETEVRWTGGMWVQRQGQCLWLDVSPCHPHLPGRWDVGCW